MGKGTDMQEIYNEMKDAFISFSEIYMYNINIK